MKYLTKMLKVENIMIATEVNNIMSKLSSGEINAREALEQLSSCHNHMIKEYYGKLYLQGKGTKTSKAYYEMTLKLIQENIKEVNIELLLQAHEAMK